MEGLSTSAMFGAILPSIHARPGIQNWTYIETGTVESGELIAVSVRCNDIFKLQLLSEPLFPLHTIRCNKTGRVGIRV